jgi:cytochrome c553
MNKNMKFCINALFGVLLAVGAAHATEGDPKAGKKKSEICQGCHGKAGISTAPNFPHLAGQFPQYIERQVLDFQSTKRSDPTMSAMAAAVTDSQDIKDIAAYFASRKQMTGKPGSKKALVAMGKTIFHQGIAENGVYACASCHGVTGRGKDANNNLFPVIAGQTKDYIVKQMKDFRSSERHNDPAGMMGGIASKMTDTEINAVAEYTSGM